MSVPQCPLCDVCTASGWSIHLFSESHQQRARREFATFTMEEKIENFAIIVKANFVFSTNRKHKNFLYQHRLVQLVQRKYSVIIREFVWSRARRNVGIFLLSRRDWIDKVLPGKKPATVTVYRHRSAVLSRAIYMPTSDWNRLKEEVLSWLVSCNDILALK